MIRSNYSTKHKTSSQSKRPESSNQDLQSVKHLTSTLIFEPTVVGTRKKKSFRIQNDTKDTQTYIAQRDPNTNPIYHVFDFKILKGKVPSGNFLECTVTYSPKVTHSKDVDYFQIIDNNFKLYKVCLQGECIGPGVCISINTLYFYNTMNRQQLTNTFEITNTSNIPVAYEFDKNKEQEETFKIDKARGMLEPFKHVYITVKFEAQYPSVYSEYLVCKVLHHEPLIIELLGAHTKHLDLDISNVLLKRYHQEELKGFNFYMSDSVKTTAQTPPFSLSVNYLDFGNIEYKKYGNNTRTLVTSLTNHTNNDIEVVWQGGNKVFSIRPQEILIPPNESVLYEIEFRPDSADRLYSKLFTGCVYWTDFRRTLKEVCFLDIIDVPLDVSLNVIGQSFPENKSWLPRVEIVPDIIILPPTMPMSPTYTTCMLKSSGHLPTLFKFIPPKTSNFIMKPMVGIIYDFKVVIIQLQPDLHDKKPYVERWGLELNGQMDNCITFYLKGYSEYPHIGVGVNNVVTFNTVHPACQDITNVMIKNNSIHFLYYNFILDKDGAFDIDHPQGQLASNESNILQWYYTGDLKLPDLSSVKCEIQTVEKIKVITGFPLDTFVSIHTKCAYSELCATPNHENFGNVLWDSIHTTAFYLFNFGLSPIHFKLVPRKKSLVTDHLNVVPTQGTVNPREKIKIIVHVRAIEIGRREIQLMYQIRLNAVSNMVINEETGYDIFFMEFGAFYPIIQIKDICSNNFGFLFSKVILWDMFRIDDINAALKELQHDETRDIKIVVPDYEKRDEHFFSNFAIRNICKTSTVVKLKRRKLCSCKPVKISKGISLRDISYHCIHVDMFDLALSDELIEPNHKVNLRMQVKYLECGLSKMLYNIIMTHNRILNLYVNVNVLPEIVTIASKYTYSYEFKLKNIFIGERKPAAQVFPLYNNSKFEIDYEIDVTPISNLNFDYDFNIFQCLNPKGTIVPFSTEQLLIVFTPIEARTYKVTAPFRMGNDEMQLQISGTGVLNYTYMSEMDSKMPISTTGMNVENLIELSVDHLIVETFPTWSTVEKMIFIRNHTSDRIIGYSWQPYIVQDLVKVEVVYRKGVLQPKESHSVIIQITSFDQPCRLRVQMACKLLDHTQHILHKESIIAYKEKEKELAGQFTFTGTETITPLNDVVILADAENSFTSLAISLSIVSFSDRDLCMDLEEQLKQSPQYSLHSNASKIFKNYFQSLVPKKSKPYFPAIEIQNQCHQMTLNKSNAKLCKAMLERMIADTIFSNYFFKIMDITNNSSEPYYPQFSMDGQSNENDSHQDIQKSVEQRMGLVEDFLNKPQTPFLASIFKELIADGVHEEFQLGPQVKAGPVKPNIYYTKRNKYKCPTCN